MEPAAERRADLPLQKRPHYANRWGTGMCRRIEQDLCQEPTDGCYASPNDDAAAGGPHRRGRVPRLRRLVRLRRVLEPGQAEAGQTIPLANITEIDDSTYDDDGYVRIGYKDAEDKLQTLNLDGQRFDGVDDMLDELFDATGLASKATKPPEAEEPAAEEEPKDTAESDADPNADARGAAEPEEKAADSDEGGTG